MQNLTPAPPFNLPPSNQTSQLSDLRRHQPSANCADGPEQDLTKDLRMMSDPDESGEQSQERHCEYRK
jgi:hypothetical protein